MLFLCVSRIRLLLLKECDNTYVLDEDVTGTCNHKYESSLTSMNATASNLLPPTNSNTSLFVFENCGSSSAIEELNFSVLHNVNPQSSLNLETRKLLKKG